MSYKKVRSKIREQDNLKENRTLVMLQINACDGDLESFKENLKNHFTLLHKELPLTITKGEIITLFEMVCSVTTNMDIIRFCLENKVDPNFQKNLSLTPFWRFCHRPDFFIIWKQSCILQLFFEHGANPNIKCNDTKILTNSFVAVLTKLVWILSPEQILENQGVIAALPDNLPEIIELFLKNKADLTLTLYEKFSVEDLLTSIREGINRGYPIENEKTSIIQSPQYKSFDKIIRTGFTEEFNKKYVEIMQKIKKHKEIQKRSGIYVKPLSDSVDPNQREQQNVEAVVISREVKALNLSDPEVAQFLLWSYKTPSERLSALYDEVKSIESERGSLHSNSGIYHY